MQYKVARGAMLLIANELRNGTLESCGVTREDFMKMASDAPWMASDRNRMNVVFFSLLSSTMDAVGVPRFQLPAEYIAAGISLFVSPVNMQTACRFFERVPTAESLGRGLDQADVCTAKQLFAIVVQLVGDPESSHAKHMFEKNCKLRLDNLLKYSEDEDSIPSLTKKK